MHTFPHWVHQYEFILDNLLASNPHQCKPSDKSEKARSYLTLSKRHIQWEDKADHENMPLASST